MTPIILRIECRKLDARSKLGHFVDRLWMSIPPWRQVGRHLYLHLRGLP